jgi:proteic killer suppression protein
MITGWKDPDAREAFATGRNKRWSGVLKLALRKLDMLNAAVILADLRAPPGNRLEALQGDRAGQHSIRINGQFRICFVWTSSGPTDVEITDHH